MKINKILKIVILILIIASCSIEKRHYLPGFYINKQHKTTNKNQVISTKSEVIQNTNLSASINENEVIPSDIIEVNQDNENIKNNPSNTLKEEIQTQKTKIKDSIFNCDQIICTNGDEIDAKVIEIGLNEIKYQKCNNPDGPTISIKKTSVLMIKYPNGTKDIITSSEKNENSQNYAEKQKTNGLALAGMICGILSLLTLITIFGGIILGIVGLTLSLIGRKKQLSNPNLYKPIGLAFAKTGFICSLVSLAILSIFYLVLIYFG